MYLSTYSCFPEQFPFYIGVVAPFGVIYIFNFIMFVAIMYSVSSRRITGKDGTSKNEVRKNAMIGLILAVTFGLGWIFGLLGTTSLPREIRFPSVIVFTILVGTQGLLIFVLRVLRSSDVRNEWKKWFYTLTCRKDSHQNRNLRHMQGSSSDTVRRGRPHTSTFRPGSTSLTSESSDTLRSRGHHSDTMHRAVQLHQLESVTEEIIEEPPVTIPQVRKLTVIENKHIADDLGLHESAPVTSQLEPSAPLSPVLTLLSQELQPRTIVLENARVDCVDDSADNAPDNADSWSELIEGDTEVTETVFVNFNAETA